MGVCFVVRLLCVIALGLFPRAEQAWAQPLPDADRVNIETTAISRVAIPAGVTIVPRSAFIDAIPTAIRSSDAEAISEGVSIAETANDPWTTGVVATLDAAAGVVAGNVWIVVDDPSLTRDGKVVASRFTISVLPTTVTSSWFGISPQFTRGHTDAGTGRCCGPTTLCDTPQGPPSPCGSGQSCVGAAGEPLTFSERETGAALSSAQHGGRGITFFDQGVPNVGFCHPRLVPSCTNTTFSCDADQIVGSFDETWSITVPAETVCDPIKFREVSGRSVPEACTYANLGSFSPDCVGTGCSQPSIGGPTEVSALGGAAPPECDGRCFGCETPQPISDRNFRVRQCALVKPDPGSGVCESTARTLASFQDEVLRLAGSTPLPDGTFGEERGCTAFDGNGASVCYVCEGSSCRVEPNRSGNPVAIDAGAASCSSQDASGCAPATTPESPDAGTPGAGDGTPGSPEQIQVAQGPAPVQENSPPPPQGTNNPEVPVPQLADDAGGPAKAVEDADPAQGGDPVNLSDGSFTISTTDLYFPGAVRPLAFTRTYNSRSDYRSELGSNWSHNWDYRVVQLNDTNRPGWVDPYCAGGPEETTCLMLHIGDTARLFTRDVTTGVFMPQAGMMASIVRLTAETPSTAGSHWLLSTADGHSLLFDEDGYLIEDADRFGNAFELEYEWNAAGLLNQSLCPAKPQVLHYNANSSDVRYVYPVGASGLYHAATYQCAALAAMTGRGNPMIMNIGQPTSLQYEVSAAPDQQVAKALVERLTDVTSSRTAESPMPWGPRMKRLTRVREIKGRSAGTRTYTGRELTLEYFD